MLIFSHLFFVIYFTYDILILYSDNFDGTDCDNIPQWHPSEPNDAGTGEDVAEIRSDGLLNDLSKSNNRAYICEFNVKIAGYTISPQSNIPGFQPYFGPNSNYYILDFSSSKDMIIMISILLNIVFIAMCCYTNTKQYISNNKGKYYSKVKMYATEDDQL